MTTTHAELPTGTVTFLFTDIEGSTRLMAELGDAYRMLQDQHLRILRDVWGQHLGHEVNTEGDSFLVVFSLARNAVAAATAAQAAVAAARWPGGVRVRIRMGVHTGYARPHRGDYVALATNQAARIMGAAHGGQILVSDDTVAELVEEGAEETPLRSLGRYRVRDFDRAVLLHRVEPVGWDDQGRPPRLRPADGHNLVRPLTSLVGRQDERAWLTDQLQAGRIVTLVGPGGVGKTRLATEIGFDVAPRWPDGVWFIDLQSIRTPEAVAGALAEAVGAPQTPGVPAAEDARRHFESRRALVILDNCEQVTTTAARLAHDLVTSCPGVGILATSRAPLGLRGERIRRLEPLPADELDAPAVALFLERASRLDEHELPAVQRLCHELAGMPLAIELAAARTTAMSASAILEWMRRSPAAIASDDPTLPERHRSLQRVLDWSLDLLPEAARTALQRLAFLADSFDLDLAIAACAGDGVAEDDVPGLVWMLLDQSLVLRDVTAGASRYRLQAPVQRHMRTLAGPAEARRTITALARHFVELLGPDRATSRAWASAMGAELDNVRGVVADLAEVDHLLGQTLAWAVGHFHELRDAYAAGIDEMTEQLRRLADPTPARLGVMTVLADLHLRRGDLAEAEAVLREAAELHEVVGAPTWDEIGLLRSQAELALRRGEPAQALALATEALDAASGPRARARAWSASGLAHVLEGDLELAVTAFEQELADETAADIAVFLAKPHGNLAEIHLRLGDHAAAARHQLACLEQARANGEPVMVGFSVMVAAQLLAADGQVEDAVRLHAAAEQVLERAGFALYDSDAERSRALLAKARAELGDAAFERSAADGRALGFRSAASTAANVLAAAAEQRGEDEPR